MSDADKPDLGAVLRKGRPPATHCANGHERTEGNTYMYLGRRTCLECTDGRVRGRRPTPAERLAKRTERVDNEYGCLEWQGYVRKNDGYGSIGVNGKPAGPHRLAWVLVNGPIPAGLLIRHVVCHNRICCDPAHMLLGTEKDNSADMIADGRGSSQRKTRCKRGHPFDEANTYRCATGARSCKACGTARRVEKRVAAWTS